jgi:hypothetical protein
VSGRGGPVVLALLSLMGGEGVGAVLEDAERRRLRARLGEDLCAALDRCQEYGLRPPVTPLRGSACGGCNVALPMGQLLALKQRLGATPCPRCRRIVYDPAWLTREREPDSAPARGQKAPRR